MAKQAWIKNSYYDGLLILSAPFLCLLLVVLFPHWFNAKHETSLVSWAILVLLVDVGHVYSTLFRTYFDANSRQVLGKLYKIIPLICLIASVITYGISSYLFWTLLAYLAVYHFIRQQYGFMRIYSRYETSSNFKRKLDAWVVYSLCMYPIVYWHISGDRQFNWFMANDFLLLPSFKLLLPYLQVIYWLGIALYLFTEIQTRKLNLPKNLLMLGTGLSWYMGIVYFNSDFSFTLFNVLAHGLPYIGLIWIDGIKKRERNYFPDSSFLSKVFRPSGIIVFAMVLIAVAYLEEYLWDFFVWDEHPQLFPGSGLVSLNKDWLGLLIPLLSVPQITHYVLDAFIWKIKNDNTGWKETTLNQSDS